MVRNENSVAGSAAYRPQWILRCKTLAALALAWLGVGVRLPAQMDLPDSRSATAPMIGQMAPAWTTQGWINANSLDIKQLRGSVILLRFIDDSALNVAAINDLYHAYHDKGLAVVGMFAPSPMPTETKLEHVRELAAAQGIEFPLGLDERWETLNRYWLETGDTEQTTSAFLIDRKGVVRYIHGDARYNKNSPNKAVKREYEKLDKEIQLLLKPDDSAGGKTAEPKSMRSKGKLQSRENL